MTDSKECKSSEKLRERDYLKQRLAGAFRIFANHGFDEGVAGHITARDPVDPTTFWVNPLGLAFSVIKASDLIHCNENGEVIGGGALRVLNTAAFMIHSAIHKSRPDVICAAHSHSVHGRAFCALGRPLDMISQDVCAFYNVISPFPRLTTRCSAWSMIGSADKSMIIGPCRLRPIQWNSPLHRGGKAYRQGTRQ